MPYQEMLDLNLGQRRSMTFFLALNDSDDPMEGYRHDLIIGPQSFSKTTVNKSAIQFPIGKPFVERHITGQIFHVSIRGNCLKAIRIIDGRQVSGESIFRSLEDLFESWMGYHPEIDEETGKRTGRINLIGSEGIRQTLYPDEFELRWFNWGYALGSSQNQNCNYYSIFPENFNFDWTMNKRAIPEYSLSFYCVEQRVAKIELFQTILQFFETNKILQDSREALNESGWTWADRLNTIAFDKVAPFQRAMSELRIAMLSQQDLGGYIPFDFGEMKSMYEDFKDFFEDLF